MSVTLYTMGPAPEPASPESSTAPKTLKSILAKSPRRIVPELIEGDTDNEGSVRSKRVKIETPEETTSRSWRRLIGAGSSKRSGGSVSSHWSIRSNHSTRSDRSAASNVSNPNIDAEIHDLSQLEAARLQEVCLADTACQDAERKVAEAEEALHAAQHQLEDMRNEKRLAEKKLKAARKEKEKVQSLKEERASLARRMKEIDEGVKRRRF